MTCKTSMYTPVATP